MKDPACRAALRFGWAAVAVSMLGGLTLEFGHFIKAPLLVDAHLRRELWTLAHAHGTGLGILNLVFAVTGEACLVAETARRRVSALMRAAGVLVPVGFFLGGIGASEGDPSLAIALVPVGAALAVVASVWLAVGAWRVR